MKKIGAKHPEADKRRELVRKPKISQSQPEAELSASGFLFSGLALIGLGLAWVIRKGVGK